MKLLRELTEAAKQHDLFGGGDKKFSAVVREVLNKHKVNWRNDWSSHTTNVRNATMKDGSKSVIYPHCEMTAQQVKKVTADLKKEIPYATKIDVTKYDVEVVVPPPKET